MVIISFNETTTATAMAAIEIAKDWIWGIQIIMIAKVTKIKNLHAIRRLFLNLFITGFTLHQQKLRRPRKA